MTAQDELSPGHAADRPLTAPETAPSDDTLPGLGPLPSPAAPPNRAAAGPAAPSGPSPGSPVPAGSLTLHTTLLGPLTVPDGAARAAELEELSRRAAVYATRARGDGTRRAYRSAWRQYEAWCHSLGREPLGADPDTVAMYVVRCADQGSAGRGGLAVSSIRVHLAAIRTAICWPAARSTCAIRASPWSSRGSPGRRASGRAARPPPRCPACCA